ncbi:hypothetical protein J6590_040223 [Homalodisca vitripennis]|nr:hypothetical protein J6590_040223 [Homalodisca vitripennis]
MYKTVRQGENSLQYHILPQDDVGSGHVMKRRRSTRHRTAFILVITLILGCAIVAAAVLIPVLMASNVVTLPARFQTFAVAASSVNMKAHGKYTLQGAQYIALLPVKDPLGHFNAYQIKPSILTTTTTTTTTTPKPTTTMTTASPLTTEVFRIKDTKESGLRGVRTENNDPHRPHDSTILTSRGELHRPRWMPNPYMPWVEHKGGALMLSLGVALVMLLATATLGLCLYLRRRAFNTRVRISNYSCTHRFYIPYTM